MRYIGYHSGIARHIKILGWIHVSLASVCLVIGAMLCIGTANDPPAFQYIGPAYLIACCVLIPELVGGIGLLRSAQYGRIVILVLSAMFVMLPPVGTGLSVYGFWALLKKDAGATFTSKKSTRPRPKPTTGLALAMVGVASGFFLVIKAGFLIHHDPQPPVIADNSLAVVALAAFAGVCFIGVRSIKLPARPRSKLSAEEQAKRDQAFAEWKALVQAYKADVNKTMTCVHLNPIERAMRGAGITVEPIAWTGVSAQCRVNLPELRFTAPLRYAEYYATERFGDQIPTAYLTCDACRFIIYVLHPDEGDERSAWFPGAKK